jgi:hypothetical protein
MSIHFQTVQDSLYALATVVGIAVIFTLGIIAASGLTKRDRARNARRAQLAPVTIAQHPVQTDDARELVLR